MLGWIQNTKALKHHKQSVLFRITNNQVRTLQLVGMNYYKHHVNTQSYIKEALINISISYIFIYFNTYMKNNTFKDTYYGVLLVQLIVIIKNYQNFVKKILYIYDNGNKISKSVQWNLTSNVSCYDVYLNLNWFETLVRNIHIWISVPVYEQG